MHMIITSRKYQGIYIVRSLYLKIFSAYYYYYYYYYFLWLCSPAQTMNSSFHEVS
jgi:hypothetical protein